MAKAKLLKMLDQHKGRDYKLEKQRKLEKKAEKRKKAKLVEEEEDNDIKQEGKDPAILETTLQADAAADWEVDEDDHDEEEEEEEEEEEDEEEAQFDTSRLADSESDSDSDGDDEQPAKSAPANGRSKKTSAAAQEVDQEDEEEEDIPLSDLSSIASEDKGDLIPYQRLTINNTTALTAALKRIAIPTSTLPFSAHQSVTTAEPVSIPDVEDELNRELAFYKQSLTAAQEGRALLKKEGVPFSRPTDFFAEMVKSDEHMGKVRQKMVDAAASKKAAAEARKQRDLKKFGKAVQVEKQRERAKEKRETLERINTLKRKRAGADLTATNEDDIFDVALEDAATTEKRDKAARRQANGKPNPKRQKKDEKFGFGGKKRYAKSNDAKSSADMSGFSTKRMKSDSFGGGKSKGGAKRPGKNRRAKMK